MVRGEWDREKMRDSDKAISQKFAVDFIESVGRGISNMSKHLFECNFNERKDNFSNESIFFKANYIITEELYKSDDKVFDTNHMVVQYICNRNELIRRLFKEKWSQVEDEEYNIIVSQMKADFAKHMNDITKVLEAMTNDLIESCSEQRNSEQNAFDSDSNFDVIDLKNSKKNNSEQKSRERESPFKAMVTYLKMYLDPKVNAEEFNKYFSEIFELDGVKIKKSDTYILCNKPNSRHCVLSEDLFKKLENTKMFNSENIFNIYEYITEFTRVVSEYKYEISREDFGTMVRDIKESYEKDVLGCPNQCPSCGKFCDRKLHPNDGKCQIKTGHQMCSMGGKAWKDDRDKSVVLFTCDDYKDDTKLILHGKMLNWRQFKEKSKMDWNWALLRKKSF
ncbi:Von willebrand factor type A domain protein [Oopsacas minuta]|uniref:von willebrand factor type A domain protein n=1 Tax=Oopsacas minuta TaxID=111878 RepID=A0AAV7JM22_9METZ|nr:Von willebrand factor type A domain protein [Oopsacas minuta]